MVFKEVSLSTKSLRSTLPGAKSLIIQVLKVKQATEMPLVILHSLEENAL
jgi:hypothetical protein